MRNMKYCISNEFMKRDSAAYAFQYTVKKLLRILPYTIIGTMMYYVTVICVEHYDFRHAIYLCLQMPLELIQLSMTGATGITLNYPIWYLSALMITLPILMYCYFLNNDFFENYMITIVPMLLYGWMNNKYHTIGLWHEWIGITYAAVIRAFADLLLGCLVFKLSEKLSGLKYSVFKRGLLTLVEIGGFVAVCLVSMKARGGYSFQCAVLLMILSLSITFSTKSWTFGLGGRLFCNICKGLGKLSIPIYCIHASVLKVVKYYFSSNSYTIKVLLAFIFLLLISVAIQVLMEYIIRKRKQ